MIYEVRSTLNGQTVADSAETFDSYGDLRDDLVKTSQHYYRIGVLGWAATADVGARFEIMNGRNIVDVWTTTER